MVPISSLFLKYACMKVFQKIGIFILTLTLGLGGLATTSFAALQPTITAVGLNSGDRVQVRVTGDPNSAIRLLVTRPGATNPVSFDSFGTTDASGNFVTTISSGTYGISPGVTTAVVVNGFTSSNATWPAYTSGLTLSPSDTVYVAPGQTVVVTPSAPVFIAYNTNSSVLNPTVVSASRVTLAGLALGSAKVTLCSFNVGCATLTVVVQTEQRTRVSLSQDTVTLRMNQSVDVTLSGDIANNYFVETNSNTGIVSTSFPNATTLRLTAVGSVNGSATLNVCSHTANVDCATLGVNLVVATPSTITLGQTVVALQPNVTRDITISGAAGSYVISNRSNFDTAVVQAQVRSATLRVRGGVQDGSGTVVVCAVEDANNCATLTVTNTATPNPQPTAPIVPGISVFQTQRIVVLSWSPSNQSTGYSGYIIYRSETAGTLGKVVGRVDKNETFFADTKGLAGKTYYYAVVYYWDYTGMTNFPQTTVRIP